MTKAIFKIYDPQGFVLGAWVRSDGGVSDKSIFQFVMTHTEMDGDRNLKHSFWYSITDYIRHANHAVGFTDKKKPFQFQMNSEGMKLVDVLFWDNNLSDKKLLSENVWGEYTYEIRFTKKTLKVKVDYNGKTKEWINKKPKEHDDFIEKMLDEVWAWVNDIDFGLNDCDCDDKKNPNE